MTGKNSCLCFRVKSTLLDTFVDSTTTEGSNVTSTENNNITMSSILYDNIIHPGIRDLEKKLVKKEGK